jgi:hypothetical protein
MGVARVAVGAAEGAPDVGVDGPVAHAGRGRIVESGAGSGGDIGDVALGAEHLTGRGGDVIIKESDLIHAFRSGAVVVAWPTLRRAWGGV